MNNSNIIITNIKELVGILPKNKLVLGGKEMNAARFYVDAEGHPETASMQNALDEMYFYTEPNSTKILGTYPRAQKNKT